MTMGGYYLSPLVRMRRGRSPRGTDQTRANWILGADNDRALVWAEDRIAGSGVERIAEDGAERIAGSARRTLADWLRDWATIPSRWSVRDTLAAALLVPPTRWAPLRPSRRRRQYEVYLGPDGLFWSAPSRRQFLTALGAAALVANLPVALTARRRTKTFVDAFTRADADLDGSTSSDGLFAWDEIDGTDFTVLSNQCRRALSGANFSTARADADLDTDDHYAQVVLAAWSHSGGGANAISAGVLCRFTGAAGTAGYGFEVTDQTTPDRRIYRYDTDANIANDSSSTTSGTIRLEVDGSSLTAKVNGGTVLGPSTNSQFAGQLRTGISSYITPGASGSTMDFDSFEAGDIVAGPAGTSSRMTLLGVGDSW
jgi:hypothetical protein